MAAVPAAEEAGGGPGKRGRKKGGEEQRRTRQRGCCANRSQRVGTCDGYILWQVARTRENGRWILKISRAQKKLVHLISGASF